ncbi:MAG TPA: YdcF family protein [Bryobacteraceae bacterium]|nr:YdcF family protein [Bryobacteraceae bacterium]
MLLRLYAFLKVALMLLGLIVVIVTITPVDRWYAQILAGPWADPDGDILIVLGAESPADGYLGVETYWRSVYAVWAWRKGHFRTIVVCGGFGTAEAMRDYLIFEHVPEAEILLENRSRSTHENGLFAAALLKNNPGHKVLLTSDYHMYRSIREFRKAGVQVEPRPIPFALKQSNDWTLRCQVFVELVTETSKIIAYRMRGWI